MGIILGAGPFIPVPAQKGPAAPAKGTSEFMQPVIRPLLRPEPRGAKSNHGNRRKTDFAGSRSYRPRPRREHCLYLDLAPSSHHAEA